MAEWKFRRRQGWCGVCERPFEEGERHLSALAILEGDLVRQDHCLSCWDDRPEAEEAFEEASLDELFWWSTRHYAEKKATVALDLESLERIFISLEGRTEQQICELRYVLSLLLMRKRRLKLERVNRDGEREELICVRPKRSEEYRVAVFDFTPDRVDELRLRLAEVFDGFDPDSDPQASEDDADRDDEAEDGDEALDEALDEAQEALGESLEDGLEEPLRAE